MFRLWIHFTRNIGIRSSFAKNGHPLHGYGFVRGKGNVQCGICLLSIYDNTQTGRTAGYPFASVALYGIAGWLDSHLRAIHLRMAKRGRRLQGLNLKNWDLATKSLLHAQKHHGFPNERTGWVKGGNCWLITKWEGYSTWAAAAIGCQIVVVVVVQFVRCGRTTLAATALYCRSLWFSRTPTQSLCTASNIYFISCPGKILVTVRSFWV